jgi:hypothetical protein
MDVTVSRILNDKGFIEKLTRCRVSGHDFWIVDGWETLNGIKDAVKDEGLSYSDMDAILGQWGFDDEWCRCSGCMNAFNIYPSFYGQDLQYVVMNEGYYCLECAKEFKDSYLEEIINEPTKAVQKNVISEQDLIGMGFEKKGEGYEQGHHEGQNADPQDIYSEVSREYGDIVFVVDNVGQFDVTFSVWCRSKKE